jgi:hypothetical protein
MDKRISAAHEKFLAANQCLKETVKAVYPVGTKVMVMLGRAWIHGKVTGHGWQPETVIIENTRTGKTRKFEATYHDARKV